MSSFDNGASVVECVRSNPSATYKVFDLVTGDVSNIAATSITVANKLYIAFKYPGVPPSTLLPQGITKLYLGFKTVDGAAITAGNADKKEIIIQVTYDTASASGVVLESYSGFLDKSKRESGVNLYLGELLKKSNLITLVNTISDMDTVVLLGASTSKAIGPNATDARVS